MGNKLLPHLQREYEGSAFDVVKTSTLGVPGVVCVATNCPAELSVDQNESIFLVVTVLVEGSCTEVVLRCPEQPFHGL